MDPLGTEETLNSQQYFGGCSILNIVVKSEHPGLGAQQREKAGEVLDEKR